MKRFYQLLLVTLFGFVVTTKAIAIEVIELPSPSSNKVIIKLRFDNGSKSDPQGKEGLTLATANMMAYGNTQSHTSSEIKQILMPMAARFGVKVDKEVSTFTFTVHQDFLDKFYQVTKELVLAPAFTEKDFTRLNGQQQNFVDQSIRASSDEEYSKKALEHLLFRGTNYQHLTQGTSASVKSLNLNEIKAHYQNVFTRHNLTIGIAGNYAAEFLTQLKQDMQQLSNTQPNIPDAGKANKPDGINVEIIAKKNAFGSAIFTGFPMDVTRSDDEFAALMVANSWLGEHRKSYSRLYQKIRQARSMNYGDYSYIEWYENASSNTMPSTGTPRSSNYMSLWIRPVQIAKQLKQQYAELADIKIGHAHFALRMAVRELDLMITNGMSEQAFEETRVFLKSYTKLYAQTVGKRLGYLMDSKFYGRDDYLFELDKLLAKVTVEDVNRAMKKHWQVNNMFITIVTDESEAQALADSIKSNAASPMAYSNFLKKGLSKEILAEDDKVAVYPLNVNSVKIIKSEDTFY